MKCPKQTAEGQELLMEFSLGSLDAARAAALEQHARDCADCAAFVASQRSVSAMLDGWKAPEVSADFDRRLYARIGREVPWWDVLVRPFRGGLVPRWLPVAAAAGVLLAAGLWVERPGATPAPPKVSPVVLRADQAPDALQEMQMMQEFSNLIQPDAEPRI